jgi:hypothetical protein
LNGFSLWDKQLLQVIETAVVDVQIHIPCDSWQLPGIGMLPELPFSFILHLVHVVMGNPVRIIVKARV